jgi:hypothetical protein
MSTAKNDPGYEVLPGEVEIWRNRLWAVTTHCMTTHGYIRCQGTDNFWVGKEELVHNDWAHTWMEHFAGTKGLDADDTIAAFCVALAIHCPKKIKPDQLIASIERVRQSVLRKKAWGRKRAAWMKAKGRAPGLLILSGRDMEEIAAFPDPLGSEESAT